MEKLNLAIIGQGRSGRNIHGAFYKKEENIFFNVKYVVEADDERRARAAEEYPGCVTFADYRDLFACKDIDLVVNATYSNLHYPITKDLLEHGFNVLCEKPFCRTRDEANDLIATAKKNNCLLTVFQQTFFAPFYDKAREVIASGKLGRITQINLRYSGFGRRWDWQTLQWRCAGGVYNTGPHPIGLALGFLDFAEDAKIIYSSLDTIMTSGDGDDCAKLLMTAPGKPLIDLEIHANDPYSGYNLKIMGSRGVFQSDAGTAYKMKYWVDEENEERPVLPNFLSNAEGMPTYCSDNLKVHEEEGKYNGSAFNVGTARLYENVYHALKGDGKLFVTPEIGRDIIGIAEDMYKATPLPQKFYEEN